MAELSGISRFPLSGAQAEVLEDVAVGISGIVGDRLLITYDAHDTRQVKQRISSKQLPDLMRLTAMYGDRPGFDLEEPIRRGSVEVTIPEIGWLYSFPNADGEDIAIDEFGDATPCEKVELFDEVLSDFNSFLGRSTLRLARKKDSWLRGEHIKPQDRANAPIHIITESTVEAVSSLTGNPDLEADRFRAGFVVAGDFEPHCEQQWVGKVIRIGELVVMVKRLTARCPVPGKNPKTGEDIGDAPSIYRHIPKVQGSKQAHIGAYLYPLVAADQQIEVGLGDKVEVL